MVREFLSARSPDVLEKYAQLGAAPPAGLYFVDGTNYDDALSTARSVAVECGWVVHPNIFDPNQLVAALTPRVYSDWRPTDEELRTVLIFEAPNVLRSGAARALLRVALSRGLIVVITADTHGPTTSAPYFEVVRLVSKRLTNTAATPTDWSELGGLSQVKARLRIALEWPRLHSDTMKRLGIRASRGVLLHGPPGCGKTSLVRAAAAASGATFISLSAASVYSCYVGEAERIVRDAFASARSRAPSLLFIDEIDAVAGRRTSSGSEVSVRVLATLLTEMDGVAQSSGVVVVAATNRLDQVDAALRRPGRFDDLVEVPLPNTEERAEIAAVWCARGAPIHDDVDVNVVAERTEGCNGAQVAAVCKEAAMNAAREAWDIGIEPKQLSVKWKHFENAFHVLR